MYSVVVDTYALTASFRIPEDKTLQRTLPLPSPTNMVGMLGAAIGMSARNAMAYRDDHHIRMGVRGDSQGQMRDLWMYTKIKGGGDDVSGKDIVIREYVTGLRMSLIYVCEDKVVAEQIATAFRFPEYALTAGNSDDLMKIFKVYGPVEDIDDVLVDEFDHCVLPGDQRLGTRSKVNLRDTPITYSLRAPLAITLPTKFSYGANDVREVAHRETFTFVSTPVTLAHAISSVCIDGHNVALLF